MLKLIVDALDVLTLIYFVLQFVPADRLGIVSDPGAKTHLAKEAIAVLQNFWMNTSAAAHTNALLSPKFPRRIRMFNSGVMVLHREPWLSLIQVTSANE